MTKNTNLNNIMKKFFPIFTIALTISIFSCSISEDTENDHPQTSSTESSRFSQDAKNQNTDVTSDNFQIKENDTSEKHVVIYGIGIRGKKIATDGKLSSDSSNKFAILYNQTSNEVNISNWKIKKAAFNNEKDSDTYKSTFNIPESTIIKSKQYLLLTRDGYDSTMWSGDVSSDIYQEGSAKLDFATTGNHIILVDASDDIIDNLDYIELSATKQKTYERRCNELYITESTQKTHDTAYIFRRNPDIDTNNSCDDFTSLTIYDECILKNSQTIN